MRIGVWGILLITAVAAFAQPSGVEHERPPGRRLKLAVGTLFLPANLEVTDNLPILVHFHGDTLIPELTAASTGVAVISIQLGEGSGVYERAFADPQRFGALLREAETKAGVTFGTVALSAWSAGYGGIRAILAVPEYYRRVDCVLLIDGLHAGYVADRNLDPEQLAVFLKFSRDAVAGTKRMIVTHSEILPGTFASTSETADCLLDQLGLSRHRVIGLGPTGEQQLTEARSGRFLVIGYSGTSGSDHVAQLYSLPVFSQWLLN